MEKTVPLFYRKGGFKAGDDCKEIILPILDRSFGCIAAMDVRWDEFEGDMILFEGLEHVVGSFVIEDMYLRSNVIVE